MSGPWTITALALLAGAALLACSMLFWDRAKGRRRCRRCWYDMTGSPTLTCPECGRPHRREADLARTRRRWGRAALTLTAGALLAHASLAAPRMLARGWVGGLPTTGLMLAAGWLPSPPPRLSVLGYPRGWAPAPRSAATIPEALSAELSERLEAPNTWLVQKVLFQRACASLAVAHTREHRTTGNSAPLRWLLASDAAGVRSLWAYRPYLDALVPDILSARKRWVAFRPFVIRHPTDRLAPLPWTLGCVVTRKGSYLGNSEYGPATSVGRLDPGVHDLTVTLMLRGYGADGSFAAEPLWTATRHLSVEIVATADELLARWSDEEVAAVVPKAVTLTAAESGGSITLTIACRDHDWLFPGAARLAAPPPLTARLSLLGPRPSTQWSFPLGGDGAPVPGAWTLVDGAWTSTLRTGLSLEQFLRQTLELELSGSADLALDREGSASFWEGSLRLHAAPALGELTLTPESPAPRRTLIP